MKQIDIWKSEAIESTIAYIAEVAKKDNEWRAKYGWHRYEYVDYKREVPSTYLAIAKTGEKAIRETVTKMVDAKYEKLQAKVEDRIGKIIEIESTGNNGFDYMFRGEKGFCEVEVIGAGGYNIQCWHTRWIIKK